MPNAASLGARVWKCVFVINVERAKGTHSHRGEAKQQRLNKSSITVAKVAAAAAE
jgi:hypothetical protein